MKFLTGIAASLLFNLAPAAEAATNAVSISELLNFVSESKTRDDFSKLIANKIENEIIKRDDLTIANGSIWVNSAFPGGDYENQDLCVKISLHSLNGTLNLRGKSNLIFSASKITEPVNVDFLSSSNLKITGKISKTVGLLYPVPDPKWYNPGKVKIKCTFSARATDTTNIEIGGIVDANFHLSLNVNPSKQYTADNTVTLYVNPEVQLTGKAKSIRDVSISAVPSGFLSSDLNQIAVDLAAKSAGIALKPLIDTAGLYWANDKLTDKLQGVEDSLNRKIAEKLLPPGEYANWQPGMPIIRGYTFPAITEELLTGFANLLNDYDKKFPISYAYLKNSNVSKELYYAYISGDTSGLTTVLKNGAACEAARALTVNLQGGRAISAEEYKRFCDDAISGNGTNLGNAEVWDDNASETDWRLTPGTNFDIGALSIQGNQQPFMKQVKYKTVGSKIISVSTRYPDYNAGECYDEASCRTSISSVNYAGNGTCKLEMRIYKNDINASGLKPIMAIHGGSWSYRGFGFFGMESQVSHLTKKGYVVFAPFYRLTGTSDGNAECNRANGADIISDVKSALTWVETNAQRFGASGKVDLFGQSAGAQLSAYLAVHEAARINSAMLLYPPADMKYYLDTQDFSVEN
ncbi:MAG: hypothetical protein RL497_183, partial [Pseudomonadota bacterium]